MEKKELEEKAYHLKGFKDFALTAKEVAEFIDGALGTLKDEVRRQAKELLDRQAKSFSGEMEKLVNERYTLLAALDTARKDMESVAEELHPFPRPFATKDCAVELKEAANRARRTIEILTNNLSEAIDDTSKWHKRFDELAQKVDDMYGGPCIICNASSHLTSDHHS